MSGERDKTSDGSINPLGDDEFCFYRFRDKHCSYCLNVDHEPPVRGCSTDPPYRSSDRRSADSCRAKGSLIQNFYRQSFFFKNITIRKSSESVSAYIAPSV